MGLEPITGDETCFSDHTSTMFCNQQDHYEACIYLRFIWVVPLLKFSPENLSRFSPAYDYTGLLWQTVVCATVFRVSSRPPKARGKQFCKWIPCVFTPPF